MLHLTSSDSVAKSGLYENILNWAKFKADQQAKKTDGSKRTR
jgi:DNA topoisomerase-2